MNVMNAELLGYQEQVEWMGSPVLTLGEVWPVREIRAMIVGLNPALRSVTAGHYYQGRSGQTQLSRLIEAGLFAAPDESPFFEQTAVDSGVGFADLVRRPTSGEKGVTISELELGKPVLVQKLADRAVPLVVCVFRHPVIALLGSSEGPGFQSREASWGAQVFRMPSPYEKRETVAAVMSALAQKLRTIN